VFKEYNNFSSFGALAIGRKGLFLAEVIGSDQQYQAYQQVVAYK